MYELDQASRPYFHNHMNGAVVVVFTSGQVEVRLRLPAGCVAIEGDPTGSRVVRVQTRLHEPGGESVEVALFPGTEDFLWELILWLRRRGVRGVV
jgi:hypothetical protein